MPSHRRGEWYEIENAYGDKLDFDQRTGRVMNASGLMMPSVIQRTLSAPTQHGATWLAMVLEPRDLVLEFYSKDCSRGQMWQNREDISAIINPWLGPFTFRAFLPTPEHKTRELRDVVYDTGFGSGFGSVHSGATRMATQLRLIAYDPVWYGKARTNTEAPGTGSTLAFEFPLNPGLGGERDFDTIEFGGGTSFAARTFNIYYNGTWPAYPVVQILGPADDPILTNNTTGEKLEFDGYNVAAGEVVTIDTRFGFKTVESDINGNIVGYLTTDTDLATFHLEIDPVAAGGLNSFTYSALNTDSDSRLTVRWTDRWVAI